MVKWKWNSGGVLVVDIHAGIMSIQVLTDNVNIGRECRGENVREKVRTRDLNV